MWCVDIRKYFNCPPPSRDGDDFLVIDEDSINDADGDIIDRLDLKPTRFGLGLRIREWRALKEIASFIVHCDVQVVYDFAALPVRESREIVFRATTHASRGWTRDQPGIQRSCRE